ncbi:tubulin-folding cofactor B [Oryza glaberrima]|uniref:tubulin-folding cofactor B n=1 Tax=Oryza glaberrima TaxID=4538 RepID=UPI00224C1DEB|nr:tubulin-folding cofactor B [Oryza glaberrima]
MSSSSSKLHLPADDSVLLLLTHSNLSTFSSDIRVSKQTSVEALKDKLWRKTGTSVAFMRLQLRDDTGAMIADLDHDDATLASYSPYDGVKGIRFFECPQGHGAIVRPEKVKVGDYPERDPFEEEEI